MAAAEASNPGKQPSVAQNPGLAEQFQHKNRLQQYAQRCAIQLPVYETINEGSPHAPKFRSTVAVDGQTFTTAQRFAHRKEAEQDVAKFALEGITKKIKQEGCPLIHGDTMFCKSILYEYATKVNIRMPIYTTSQSVGLLPVFISSVAICEKTYNGGPGKNKKEAEQIAARAAIESILGHSSTRTIMTQIIKSKSRLYNAIHKGSDSVSSQVGNVVMGQLFDAASIGSKKVKQEYTRELTSCSIGSGILLPYQPQGVLLAAPVSKCLGTVTDEPHLASQLENVVPSVDSVRLSCQSECIASSSGNKRENNNELESRVKRMRNDEENAFFVDVQLEMLTLQRMHIAVTKPRGLSLLEKKAHHASKHPDDDKPSFTKSYGTLKWKQSNGRAHVTVQMGGLMSELSRKLVSGNPASRNERV